MVAGVLSKDDSLRSAVVRNNADRQARGLPPSSINTAAYSDGRTRLNLGVLVGTAKGLAVQTNAAVPEGAFWEKFTPYVIDGTTVTANDTNANQQAFPQHASQADGVGFPILRVVAIQSLLTGMICELAVAPFKGKGTGEMALAREILPALKGNALLLGDRYFPSFFLLADLLQRGWNGIFPSHGARAVDFRRGKSLGKKDHLVTWDRPARPAWMSESEYEKYPSSITMRELEVREKQSGTQPLVIVTTLIDESKYPKSRISAMYKKRWKVEVALRDLKDTFGMGHIAAGTPAMIEKIIWAHVLAYNVLRWHMLNASALYCKEVDEVSVTGAAAVITANAVMMATVPRSALAALFSSIYAQIVQVPVGRRPGRVEPRAIKKRPKPRKYLMEKRSAWHARQSA